MTCTHCGTHNTEDAGPSIYLSYQEDGTIYYEKEIITDRQIVGIMLKYPTSVRSTGDRLAETIPPTLKNLP